MASSRGHVAVNGYRITGKRTSKMYPQPRRTVDPAYLRMPEEHDPAGEGHMFTPGPDWPSK